MLRRKGTSPLPGAQDAAGTDQFWNGEKDIPRSAEELTPSELMAMLTAEGERKIDAAFGRAPKNSK